VRAVHLLLLLALLGLGGCSQGAQSRGDRLTVDLKAAYPDQIVAIGFEFAPPLDPAMLFIDLAPSMNPEAQRRFLCDEIRPRVEAAGGGIDATVSYGWYMSEECP
jgi:hypothetical protein